MNRLDAGLIPPAPAEYRRTEFDRPLGLWKPKPDHTKRGTTSQAAAATGRLQTVGGFTLPVAAAFAASDVVPARRTPDGVSDAERHRLADEMIGDHEYQRLRL